MRRTKQSGQHAEDDSEVGTVAARDLPHQLSEVQRVVADQLHLHAVQCGREDTLVRSSLSIMSDNEPLILMSTTSNH